MKAMYATDSNANNAYNARQAAQVITYFALKNDSRKISVLKVVKLVYLSDRESLAKFGFPILTERRVSMKHGPVNSQTYNNIKQDPKRAVDLDEWSKFLTAVSDKKIGVRSGISRDALDELSSADISILDEVWDKFGHMTPSQLRRWTHDNCPEYEEVEFGSKTIELRRLVGKVGLTREQYEEVVAQESIDKLFRSLAS